MGCTDDLLDDVRAQLAPADSVLKEARERRDIVADAAMGLTGAGRTFASGSLAHKTANCPIHLRDKGLDADGGVVLSRVVYNTLGPDSGVGTGPNSIVTSVMSFIAPTVQRSYPGAQLRVTKRAIFVDFHDPLPSGEDPTVDLVVGLERRNKPGLWIPNTELRRWDASHPEKHTELMTAEPKQLRLTRAHAIRLAKAENKRTGTPPLCSFNLEALAWMFVEAGMGQSDALLALWAEGARDLAQRFTPDPAGVSGPIKVADRAQAVTRLRYAAGQLETALARDDDPEWVRRHLKSLWPDFVADGPGTETKARAISRLKAGATLGITAAGALSTTAGATLKSTRSYGSPATS